MITLEQQLSRPDSSEPVASQLLRLAVFDCDGTLVDSAHSIVSSMQAAFAAHGHGKPEPDAIRRVVGLPLEDAVTRLLPDLDHDSVWSIREGYRDYFLALRDKGEVHEPLYQGALEALKTLDTAGWILGVATGKAMRGLEATLQGHGLQDRFVTLQTADRSPGKPNPDMLYKAMAETGAEASSTVMIGDTTYDMEMARNAGTLAIGVAWGYHEIQELKEAGAQLVIDTYDQLPHAMENLTKALS